MPDFDIIISGGGFAGLTAAAGFSGKGLKIAVIEAQSLDKIKTDTSDKRTTALSHFSKKFFEKIGLWNELSKNAGPINDIKIVDADYIKGDSKLDLFFSKDDVKEEVGEDTPMGYILENHHLKKCLLDFCLTKPDIKIFESQNITSIQQNPISVEVVLSDNQALKAKLLIAAEGRNSKARELLSIKTFDKDYNQIAITFNLKHELPHNCIAIERFMPTGPFAALPMTDPNQSSIVWSVDKNTAPFYINMPEAEFQLEIEKRLCGEFGEFEITTPRSSYPLSLKYAETFTEGRCVLVADAAHGIHPISGQGFNQGVRDIALLTDLMVENLSLGLDIGDASLLSRYNAGSRNDNLQMVLATDFFNAIFSNDNKLATIGRRLGIKAVDKINPIKRFFIKRAMGA